MMADLVRDHVRLGEIARRAEAALHVVEERGVEIDALVVGAIERPHRGLAGAARGARAAGVEHQARGAIARARRLEDVTPYVLGGSEDLRDELARRIGRHAFARRGLAGARRRRLLRCIQRVEHLSRVEAEEGGDDRDHHAADAEAAAETDAAAVLDVGACPLVAEVHGHLTGAAAPSCIGRLVPPVHVASGRRARSREAGWPSTRSFRR